MSTVEKDDRAKQQAKTQLASIVEMVEALRAAQDAEDQDAEDEARQAIQEDPLSVQVRGGWHSPSEASEDEEFEILLCTGGPACRIVGELGQWNEPETAQLEYQDWLTPWEEYPLSPEEEEVVLKYCRCFYFGE